MTNDGTQDPVPPPVLADPLAGLVTGNRYEQEPLRVRVVEPAMPDITAVRAAMANVFDEDSELTFAPLFDSAQDTDPPEPTGAIPAHAPPSPAAEPAPPAVAKVPVAKVPTQVRVTRVPPPVGIPAQRSGPPGAIPPARRLPPAIVAEKARRIRVPRGFAPSGVKPPSGTKGTSSAGAVALIMVLLLVIAIIAIVFLVSLVDTISSIFS